MKHKEALAKRDRLARSLPEAAEILRGSLLQRTIRHKHGCAKCARGDGHPMLVLNVNYPGGKNQQISLRPEQKEQVERCLQNYQKLKSRLEEICDLNQVLLRPEP